MRYGKAWSPSAAAAGGQVDAVFDVVGKTAVEDLISLVPGTGPGRDHRQLRGRRGGRPDNRGGADSQPMEALALVAELLVQNQLVIKVQTFPFDRAAEAYRISLSGHVRGKLVLVP